MQVLCSQIGRAVSNSLAYGELLGSCAKRTALAAACCTLCGVTTPEQLSQVVAACGIEVMHCRKAALYVYDRSSQNLMYLDYSHGAAVRYLHCSIMTSITRRTSPTLPRDHRALK
jgi:hypothetical protein